MASGAVRFKPTKIVNWHNIYNGTTTTSITDLFTNASEGITDYWMLNTDSLTDWGTKTKTYYCDIRISKFGSLATINVFGCDESGAPLMWTCQKVSTLYIWRKVTLETP